MRVSTADKSVRAPSRERRGRRPRLPARHASSIRWRRGCRSSSRRSRYTEARSSRVNSSRPAPSAHPAVSPPAPRAQAQRLRGARKPHAPGGVLRVLRPSVDGSSADADAAAVRALLQHGTPAPAPWLAEPEWLSSPAPPGDGQDLAISYVVNEYAGLRNSSHTSHPVLGHRRHLLSLAVDEGDAAAFVLPGPAGSCTTSWDTTPVHVGIDRARTPRPCGGGVPPAHGGSAIDHLLFAVRLGGSPATLARRRLGKRVEEVFGWVKTVGGFRRTRYRGLDRTGLAGYLLGTAYNLARMARLMTAATPAPPGHAGCIAKGCEAAPHVTGPEAGPPTDRHTTRQRVTQQQ